MNLLRQVTLTRASRKADKSASLHFTTQLEQTKEEMSDIDGEIGQSGILYFKPSGELTQKEIDEIEKSNIEVEGKTLSQKLRNVLYVYNQQNDEKDFNSFYSTEMNKIIEHYKNKLT
jgi:hypothetical protein